MTSQPLTRHVAPFALLIALFAACGLGPLHADTPKPFLHPLFTDNMVLQRGMVDPVWGWTTPGTSVSVSFHGKTTLAVAGPDGEWTAKVGPFTAGGPYTLTVAGPQTVTLQNVMLGDVWLCSGQSNMEFGIGNGINADAETAAADYPNIRLFTVLKTPAANPLTTTGGQWQPCTPQTVRGQGTWNGFSAVGYFFGRDLQQKIHVPIGLLLSSWGGTPAEAWTSETALRQKVPDFNSMLDQLDASRSTTASLDQQTADWYAKNDPGTAANWQTPAFDDSAWKTMALPQLFQDAGIPELTGINGVVWFRRTFDLPASDTGKAAVLHLLADDNETTWVNGTQVGATIGYSTPRAYALAAGLLKPTGNVVAVRVLDTGGKGGIYGDPSGLSLEVPGGEAVPLAGPWHCHLGAVLTQMSPLPVAIANNPNFPSTLFNGQISPLIPFGIKGALWYQGEANAGRADQYRQLLPAMIGDWRQRWGEGNFPFYIVQLAGWGDRGGDSWPPLRQAQWLTAQNVPGAGIATAIDIGDVSDIHPKNKQEVGRRLALVAEAKAYGLPVSYTGPVYQAMTVTGSLARLTFSHFEGGLVAQGGTLFGFTVAGSDGKFVPADARIDGSAVVVSSPQVPQPAAVRYDWAGYPSGTLYDKAGLPAFPFDTGAK